MCGGLKSHVYESEYLLEILVRRKGEELGSLPSSPRLRTRHDEIPLVPPRGRLGLDQHLLGGPGPAIRRPRPPRAPGVAHHRLPGQRVPQGVEGDGGLGQPGGGLVPDGPQGLDARGVDRLDVADEVELGLQGGEHGRLLGGGPGRGQGGQAEEVVQGGWRYGWCCRSGGLLW